MLLSGVLAMIALCVAMTGQARVIDLVNVSREARGVDVHVRSTGGDWRLVWEQDTVTQALLHVAKTQSRADDISGWTTVVTLHRRVNGQTTTVAQRRYNHDDAEFSVRMAVDEYGSRVYVNAGDEYDLPQGFELPITEGTHVCYESVDETPPVVISAGVEYVCQSERSRFADIAELKHYLETSTDMMEGVWTYLDRDVLDERLVSGGRYMLATVRSVDNPKDYEVVYLSGATVASDKWTALDIKGWLRATTFVDTYDVEWVRADDHRTVGRELEAYCRRDGNVLAFTFPVIGSTVRFARGKVSDLR